MSGLRPHQRRALQGQSTPDPLNEPLLNPPPPDLIEKLEAMFPIVVPSTGLTGVDGLADLSAQVLLQQGQQEVIQFIRNLQQQGN